MPNLFVQSWHRFSKWCNIQADKLDQWNDQQERRDKEGKELAQKLRLEMSRRIRGDNPPIENIERAQTLTDHEQTAHMWGGGTFAAGAIVSVLGYFVDTSRPLMPLFGWTPTISTADFRANIIGYSFIALIVGFGITVWEWRVNKKNKPLIASLNQPIPLHTFNTEFTSLLADNSKLSTVIYFHIPTITNSYIEPLNRITEAKLLRFCSTKETPPTAAEIEDHLRTALLQFQNENPPLCILRLEVVTNIHLKQKRTADV